MYPGIPISGLTGDWVSLMIDDDIDAIITKGEERTAELNSKYEGLNFDDLSNFKSETAVQQWEGRDYQKVTLFVAWRCRGMS